VALLSNASLAALKARRFSTVVNIASAALELQPQNAKVLYRRAVARHQTHDLPNALKDVKDALKLAPHDDAVLALRNAIEAEDHARRERSRQKMSKMFQ
jgi:regulator of sirC expression with transglutaminase-like and TPR domain